MKTYLLNIGLSGIVLIFIFVSFSQCSQKNKALKNTETALMAKQKAEADYLDLVKSKTRIDTLWKKGKTKVIHKTDFKIPKRSNQRLNGYLKELATICGINKPLTTITARHTYATLMLELGMPIESISHIMGHSNIKTTRGYAKLLVNKIEMDLNRLGIEGV